VVCAELKMYVGQELKMQRNHRILEIGEQHNSNTVQRGESKSAEFGKTMCGRR
jgi:hypothetical protein